MKKWILISLIAATVAAFTPACAGKATDQEVEQMCRHLAELRGPKGDDAETSAAEELGKCKADRMVADVSSETAACRIAAKDVDTFWNKCR